jgi:DNA-binding LacI/PurR family transcriptional regulator
MDPGIGEMGRRPPRARPAAGRVDTESVTRSRAIPGAIWTLAQDPQLLAGTAVDMTLRRLETATSDPGPTADHVVLLAQLVQRASTA